MTTGLVRSFACAALVAVGTLGVPVVACASSILLGPSSGSYGFQSLGGGLVNVNTGGISISGTATFQADSGAYTLGAAASSFQVGPQNGNQFPATGNSTQTFSYTGLVPADGDKLTGTITWSFIQDGTPTPHFFGSLLVSTVMGDSAFTNTFAPGQTLPIDLITQALMSATGGFTLEDIANGTARSTALVGSGALNPIPLPAALPLLATGLGALGLLGWRRKRTAKAGA
jgi:hypothetical protein